MSEMPVKWFWGLLLAATLVGGGLRVFNLNGPSWWVDESITAERAIECSQGVWSARRLQYVPFMFGLQMTVDGLSSVDNEAVDTWKAAGIEPWKVRFPAAVFGVLAVLALGWAARPVIGARAAVFLAWLIAFSPWHLWMSQSGRFYTPQWVFFGLSLLLYFRGTNERSHKLVIAAIGCFVLAFISHITAVILVGILLADLIANTLRKDAAAGYCGKIIGLSALAMLVVTSPVLWGIIQNPGSITQFNGSPQSIPTLVLGVVFMVGLPVAVLVGLGAVHLYPAQARLVLFALATMMVPVCVFVVLGFVGLDVHVRYTFPGLFGWLLLAAVTLDAAWPVLRERSGVALALSPLALVLGFYTLTLYGYYTSGTGFRARWADAFAYVEANRQEGDAVAGDYVSQRMARYYLQTPDVYLFAKQPKQAELKALGASTWIVYRSSEPAAGYRASGLDRWADLVVYFNNQVLQPFHALGVYRYPRAEQAAALEAEE